ncbi:MAG: SulP family inorganic anion transporter, partial [Bacteroidales bacterium]
FFSKWQLYITHIADINPAALLTGIITLAIITTMPKIAPRLPGSLVAIVLVTIGVYVLHNTFGITGIETIGDRFTITSEIKAPEWPSINMDIIKTLLPPAFTIAMLGAIESLLSATVADGVTGMRHNSNTELIAQGAANIISPLFGGIPVTGAIARTMTNINSGGKTPIAGIIHAIVLLLILLLLAPLAIHIPMPCLAAILIIVAYNMSGWRTIRSISSNRNAEVAVLWVTLLLTVIFDLNIAIEIGMLMAVILFIRRVTENVHVSVFRKELDIEGKERQVTTLTQERLTLNSGVEVYEIDGPFFFGVANKFDEQMRILGEKSIVRILRMRNVPFIDTTGLHNLKIFIKTSHKEGIDVILSGVNPEVYKTLETSGITEYIKKDNIYNNIRDAVARANTLATAKTKQDQ